MKYFLGSSSPSGHINRFNSIISDVDYYTYIIKGGPGTGKSSLIKRVAEAFPDEDREYYYCSSSPESLDAVILKKRKVVVVDGTAPHVFEADYPGAVQSIVNIGEYLDKNALRRDKAAIIEADAECRRHHARCRRFLTALSAIAEDTYNIAASAVISEKLEGFASRLSKKLFPKRALQAGEITYKQLSAVTSDGYFTHIPESGVTIPLCDSFFAGSELFLRKIVQEAGARGYKAEVSLCCCCPQNGRAFEHVLIPEAGVCFMSSNALNNLAFPGLKPVRFKRFYDNDILSLKKNRLKFNLSAVQGLSREAAQALSSAKEAHDRLEAYYIAATDFTAVDTVIESLINEISIF